MATDLTYGFVTIHEEDGVLIVGFASAEFGAQHYLMFQRYVESEDEEEEIYLERDGQEQAVYSGIERFLLSRQNAFLWLSSETAHAIGTEREIRLQFSASDEQFQQLQVGLERLFAGQSVFEVSL